MTTELITTITALDRSKEAADQATLNEIKKQRDLYKTTMYKFAEILKSLTEKKTSLQEDLLVIPLSGVHKDLNGLITREPDHLLAVPSESTDAILNKIEELDGTKQQLTQELIEKCSQQRDKYREGLYKLKGAITSCEAAVSNLEHHLALQAHLLTPKKSAPKSSSESPSGSTKISPNKWKK
jgi:uncharacterized coiled-coil DUF342 family protein